MAEVSSGTRMSWAVVRGSLLTSGVLITALVLLALNMWVVRHDVRQDMTREGIYTLSPASQRVLDEAKAPIHVEVFLSEDMPPPLHTTRTRLEDMLEEYAAAGPLTYTITATARGDDSPQQRGCREVALSQRTSDSMSVRAVYRCLVFTSAGRVHVVPDMRLTGQVELDNLELEITRGLLTLTRSQARRLGFVTGLGGPADVPGFVETARAVFDELYGGAIEPVELDLSVARPRIPNDLDAVVILNVDQRVSDVARFELDEHLRTGGAIGWFQSSSTPDKKRIKQLVDALGPTETIPPLYRPVDTGLTEHMAYYGVEHRHDLVLDASRAVGAVVWTPKGVTSAENPAVFRADVLARELSFLRYTSVLVLPAPSSLRISTHARENPSLDVTVAAMSGLESIRVVEPLQTRTYEAAVSLSTPDAPRGTSPLIVAIEGMFPVYYAQDLPEGITESDRRTTPAQPGRLLVMGSGDFILPQPAFGYDKQLAEEGQQLFFQSLEWLLQDDALAEIRDRRTPEFLEEIPASRRWRVQFINIVFVPMSFLCVGYGMFLRRRRRKKFLQEDS